MEPNDAWLKLLSDHGVSVMFVCFTLFAILPALWYGGRKIVVWFGEQATRIIDGHISFLNTTSAALQQSVETQSDMKDLIMKSGAADTQFAVHATEKLGDIHEGVKGLHVKVDKVLEKHGGS